MAVGKTFTSDMDPTENGLALTYVVPASACDLNCSFCFIRQRNEATHARLSVEDYTNFLDDVSSVYPVRVNGLQGYEPLLDESWDYTQSIVRRSNELGIATSLVTNGTHLARRAHELSSLGLKDLTVSLDAPHADIHDRIRGKDGAFKQTILGIETALEFDRFRDRLVVASVLLPKRRAILDDMPKFLAAVGVRYFGVTPLLKVGAPPFGRMVQQYDLLFGDLDILHEQCEREGITFVVDDELKQFRHLVDGANRFMIHSLDRPDRLVRLTPSGACSIGRNVLLPVDRDTPVWQPNLERPSAFLHQQGIDVPLKRVVHERGEECVAA